MYLVKGSFFEIDPRDPKLPSMEFEARITADQDNFGKLEGTLRDDIGRAFLSHIGLTESEFCFDLTYEDPKKRATVHCYFVKQADGTWYGQYSGEGIQPGPANCAMMEVPDDFFVPPLFLREAKRPLELIRSA